MNLYLESSAALRDVLEGADAAKIRSLLASAEVVATSRLTMADVSRVLARLRVLDPQAAASVALVVLSTDERIRANVTAVGLSVRP